MLSWIPNLKTHIRNTTKTLAERRKLKFQNEKHTLRNIITYDTSNKLILTTFGNSIIYFHVFIWFFY